MFELLYSPRTRSYCVYNSKEDHRFRFSRRLEVALRETTKGNPFTYYDYIVLDKADIRSDLKCDLTHKQITEHYPEYFI